MNDFTVIFDMDGVIVDSEQVYQEIEKKLYDELALPVTSEEHRRFIGTSERSMWRYMKDKYKFGPKADDMVEEERKRFLELLEDQGRIPAMEGIHDLIFMLDQNNIRMWVASSSTRIIIDRVLQNLNIQKYFTGVVSGDEVDSSKPAPDIFLLTAEKAGIQASQCLVIEDSENGIIAARTAGMKVVGLLNPNSGNMDLSGADKVVKSHAELNISVLQKLYDQK